MSYEKLGFESGQVLKAEHLNHIEDGIAAAGGDWNLMKNKPFYEETELKEVSAEITTIKAPYTSQCYGAILTDEVLELGETYKFKFNGTEYECVAHKPNFMNSPDVALGNGKWAESYQEGIDDYANDEPFCIGKKGDGNMTLYTETAGTYTLSVEKNVISVKPIDPKYLPETGGGGAFVVNVDDISYPPVADKTLEEIKTAFENGMNVVAHYQNYILPLTNYYGLEDSADFGAVIGVNGTARYMWFQLNSWGDPTSGYVELTETGGAS